MISFSFPDKVAVITGGAGGIGTLGQEAYDFADFLVKAGMKVWQVLPMGPTGYGESPYQSSSVFAGNPMLISVEKLAEDGLTVTKTYKTGEVEVAHPLLSELPRHVESANKCLATIGNMISERGAKKQKAARDLDAFRLNG